MADLVERFETFKKNLASEERAKPKRRQDRLDDRRPAWEIGVGSNSKYRDGWDRIFGSKARNAISDEGEK